MMKLSDATALYLGSTPVEKVLLGTEQVWPGGTPPVEPLSIWYPSAPTGIVSTSEGGIAYTLGQRFNITVPGTVTHLCFYREGDPQPGRKLYLWDWFTLAKLAEVSSPESLGWNACALETPVHIVEGFSGYVVGYDKPAGENAWYRAHGNYSWPVDRGALVGLLSGTYAEAVGTLPTLAFQQSAYFADLIFVPD